MSEAQHSDLEQLRADRDAAAKRGDHAEALILNDRIRAFKNAAERATTEIAHSKG